MAQAAGRAVVRVGWLTGWRKWLVAATLGAFALLGAAVITLNTPIGQRFIADRIAGLTPASGLRIEIGRIEGDIFGRVRLNDVVLSDPKGPFLQVPLVDLDWRPLSWFARGLDVRQLVSHRGSLTRLPEFRPRAPDSPILPDFDIRIDRFQIEGLTIAEGVAGETRHRVDLLSRVRIRDGRALVKADGTFGRYDRLHALLDAEPDRDSFDIDLDYEAPRGGVLAGLLGVEAGYRARIAGEGTWQDWLGHLVVTREGQRFAAFRLTNNNGTYGLLGQLRPAAALSGTAKRLAGETVSLSLSGTFDNRAFDGRFVLRGEGLDANGKGVVDLADNTFERFALAARLRRPDALSPDAALEGAVLTATLDGPFRDLSIDHRLVVRELATGDTRAVGIRQQGRGRRIDGRLTVPLDVRVARIESGNAWLDPQLVEGRITGTLTQADDALLGERLAVRFPRARADLALRGDLRTGRYHVTGPVDAASLQFDNVGEGRAGARIAFATGGGAPWTLRADIDVVVSEVTNATLSNLAGPRIDFRGAIRTGSAAPLSFHGVQISADNLSLGLDGVSREGTTTLAGAGQHRRYGPFSLQATLAGKGPEAVLVLAHPLPSAGMRDVRLALAPTGDGFRIEAAGESTLGPFSGLLHLVSPANGPTRMTIDRLAVWQTDISGNLVFVDGAARGSLALAGGGIEGSIALLPRGGGQGFDADIVANGAHFGGQTRLVVARADIDLSGSIADGASTINGNAVAQGITYGKMFVGRVAARTNLVNGAGKLLASVSGRRGSRFQLNLDADVAPERLALALKGDFAGTTISMPRRALLTRTDDGGWSLAPAQLSYGAGHTLARGHFGGEDGRAFEIKFDRMPLSLVDIALADIGLGGTASGVIDYRAASDGVPAGNARLMVKGLTRSGLMLTSHPIDVALVAELTPDQARLRAALDEDGVRRGRIQARVAGLRAGGTLFERLQAGALDGQLRYDGPAAALWRLAALETFDVTGPVRVAADARGTLADPRISGVLAGDGLRLQSALSGTDIRNLAVRGRFQGPRLSLTRLRGEVPEGGTLVGGGTVDFTGLGERLERDGSIRGPQLDVRLAAKNARLINANGLSATVTGPLRIVSKGIGGTIAGRLMIDRARWRLGNAAEAQALPQVRTREINQPANIAPARRPGVPWRYLIDARSTEGIEVEGLGLESTWRADVRVRGTTAEPRIGGDARMVRGFYTFASTRFELTRGRIDFDENGPIDPRLDIRAETERDGLSVEVQVGGRSERSEISFSSNPSLPEDEILSRLLFGNSITDLSATDALQLGAAVASLRGGGGVDPINRLRGAIGLDRLRIVGADPALDRGTGVALGKYFGRRFYLELITDGRAYSATELEFRITSWLSLLGTVSTIGRDSAVIEVSRDY